MRTRYGYMCALGLALAAATLVGCGDDESPTSPGLETLEIVGRVSLSSPALAVDILDDVAYVAASQAGLVVVDLSDPADPSIIGRLDTRKRANAVAVARTHDGSGTQRDIAFLVEGTEGIVTFDISDPWNVVDFEQGTTAVDGTGICIVPAEIIGEPYLVYLADSWKGIRVFFSNPEYPGVLDYRTFKSTYGYTKAITVMDNIAYVAEDEQGLTTIDVSNVRTGGLEVIGNCDTPGNALDVALDGSRAFIADGAAGMQIMEIDANHNPTILASLDLDGECQAVAVDGGMAFLAANAGGLHVVDVRDPSQPELLTSVPTPGAMDVAVVDEELLCIADVVEGLIICRRPLPPEASSR